MEIQKVFQKKLKRKNFFYSLGAGVAGYAITKSFLLSFLGRNISKDKKESDKVSVKINPYAVSRNKIGGTNGRS